MSDYSGDGVKANRHVHLGWGNVKGMEGDVSAELFTIQGLPDVGVDAFVVVGSRVWDLVRGERMVFDAVFEGELGRTCEHRLLELLEDFAIEGVNLGGRGRRR